MTRTATSLVIALVVCAIGLVAAPASAQRAVAFFQGARAGIVPGGSSLRGYEGWHDVALVRHEIVSPRDPATGFPTGRREHTALRLRMPESVGSVLFHRLLATNENLPSVQVVMFSADGMTSYTIDLLDASVARVRTAWSEADGVVYEIELTYSRITWTHEPGGITATDELALPR